MLINIGYPLQNTWLDYPDNINNSVSVVCTGCDHNCKDCHNPYLQDYFYQNEQIKQFTIIDLYNELKLQCKKQRTTCVVFSGGDFLYYKNIKFTKQFLENYSNEFNFCVYTGYDVDYVKKTKLWGFTFLKTGCYQATTKIQSEKTDEYVQYASTNQKLYDMNYKLLSENGRYYFK